jgi:hypothetical protein
MDFDTDGCDEKIQYLLHSGVSSVSSTSGKNPMLHAAVESHPNVEKHGVRMGHPAFAHHFRCRSRGTRRCFHNPDFFRCRLHPPRMRSPALRSVPLSIASNCSLLSIPQRQRPSSPSWRTTRWQGMATASGLVAQARVALDMPIFVGSEIALVFFVSDCPDLRYNGSLSQRPLPPMLCP